MDEARALEVFLDVQRGLPRQGPGCDPSTLDALAACRDRPERAAVLDVGCGPGLQTIALARAQEGRITAVDIHREFLVQLVANARAAGVAERVRPVLADMGALPFPPASFDLVWAEGSAYVLGFEMALDAWRSLLVPGGYVAVSDLIWLRPDPPAEVAGFFAAEYPDMTDAAARTETVAALGYELVAEIHLPDDAWWDRYYGPLEAKLPAARRAVLRRRACRRDRRDHPARDRDAATLRRLVRLRVLRRPNVTRLTRRPGPRCGRRRGRPAPPAGVARGRACGRRPR